MNLPSTADLAAVLIEHEGATPETAAVAAGLVLDAVQLDASGQPVISLKDLVAKHRETFPSLFSSKPADKPSSRSLPRGFTEKASSDDRTRAALAAASQSNPWVKATLNVTFQAFIEARDPALAAQMKAAARG